MKRKRQLIRLACMNPDSKTVYVLLPSNKLLELCPNPSDIFLLRNYGSKARVLEIAPEVLPNGQKPIAIEYHEGHLLLVTETALIGWRVH